MGSCKVDFASIVVSATHRPHERKLAMTSLKNLCSAVKAVTAVALISVALTSVSLFAQSGASFYVSKSGNNTNSGSFTAPWLTIQHAASSVSAGATVFVEAGVYTESVTFPASGTASNYITFTNYPGQTAVIDGTGLSVSGSEEHTS